jgi:hypothetical protein
MKIYLPPLHIKLGLIKILVKTINKEGEGLIYLRQKFPRMTEAKIKEGIFVGREVKQLCRDTDFGNELNSAGGRDWQAFGNACSNFLGNKKLENYVEKLWRSYLPHTVSWGAKCR